MLDEIKEQPHILARLLRRFFRDDFSINCDIPLSDEEIRGISDITVVASGSSKNVGDVAASYLHRLLNIPVRVEFSSEFCADNSFISKTSFVVAISQSGETTDTYEALEAAAEKTNKHSDKVYTFNQSFVLPENIDEDRVTKEKVKHKYIITMPVEEND